MKYRMHILYVDGTRETAEYEQWPMLPTDESSGSLGITYKGHVVKWLNLKNVSSLAVEEIKQ